MAKKSVTKTRDAGKTRFELRFDEDLYTAVKKLADETDISVNQLMQGVARWAVAHAFPNEEPRNVYREGVDTIPQPGCIWFGREATTEEVRIGPDPDDLVDEQIPAEHYFTLDFTERHVVRGPVPVTDAKGGNQ